MHRGTFLWCNKRDMGHTPLDISMADAVFLINRVLIDHSRIIHDYSELFTHSANKSHYCIHEHIMHSETHPSLISSCYSSYATHMPISHQGIICSCLQATPSLVKTFQSFFMSYTRRTALSQEMTENERERGRGSDTGYVDLGRNGRESQTRGEKGAWLVV